jgi:hypothetical protein
MIPNIPGLDIDLIGTAVAAALTFFVFSYLLGDLPGLGPLFKFFYRLAMHILVGVGVAYALIVGWWSILYPRLLVRLVEAQVTGDAGKMGIALVGAVLGILLLTKGIRSLAWLGNFSTAFLIGVGIGVATGGAVIGTLYAQSQATASFSSARSVSELVLMFVGALGTLAVLGSFTFTATGRKGLGGLWAKVVRAISGLGRFFLYIALGAAFAAVYVAGVSVLIGRVQAVLPLVLNALVRLGIWQ